MDQHLQLRKAVTAGMAFEREQMRNNEIAAEKHDLLGRLDMVDCMEKHEHTRKQRQQTTGEWLFAEQPYID
ncbi:hypothetical protein BDN67DRAFT_695768 [Paxillus ammoniavirescens]|nr:hypothetical protein BDN67DRAFT_695768 [Paxillus ammoniavirescens]